MEHHPQLQEEIAHSMGIGNNIIEHLHEVMEQDVHESDILFHKLIAFFNEHGNFHLSIYDINNMHARLFQINNKQERVQDTDSLFLTPEN